MTDEQRKQRNLAIREAKLKTAAKRQSQVCRVYQCKIQENKLSSKQKEQLKMMFVEAKWLYNDILSWSSIEGNNPWEYKISKTIKHYDKDGNEIKSEFEYLHSQMKQEVQKKICSSIRGLATLKKHGHNVGKLKFISEYKSLHIKQVNNLKFMEGKYVKVPNVNGLVRVNGLNQFIHIPNIDIACIDLVNTPSGYYLKFCTYQDKNSIKKIQNNDKIIGVDFGCSTSFTTSEGKKYDAKVRETDRLKRLQRQLSKKQGFRKGEKKSNNFRKHISKIRKEYRHISNIKNDKANKLANELLQNKIVVMQNEQIASWHKKDNNHNNKKPRAVQHSILGRVKSRLVNSPNVVVLSKWCPTTKLCTNCGNTINMPENKRTFKCNVCGTIEDRDIHAANNMIWLYENKIGVGRTKLTHVEMEQEIALAIKQQSSKVLSAKHEGTML